MIVIGLTGGIGTGKTTVSQFMSELGAIIIDADKVGHEVLKDPEAKKELVAAFGEGILGKDGEIERPKLAALVFKNPKALEKLNSISHPRMREKMKWEIGGHSRKGTRVVVLEAAILLEAGWDSLVDEIWVTVAPEPVVIGRMKPRLSEEETRARIRSQMSEEDRKKRADLTIDTNGTLEEVRKKVLKLWEGFGP